MAFIERINKKDDSIILELYKGEDLKSDDIITLPDYSIDSDLIRIAVLDVETTGIDLNENEIIELAIKVIEINKHNGSSMRAIGKFESYNDPGFEISEEISSLTGITNDDVKDQHINWENVKSIFNNCQLLVAHNARFDRKFVEKYIQTNNVWACSQKDIQWKNRGFFKNSLELLCIWHGFYYEAHRAMNDVNSTINLIAHSSYNDDMPLIELIKSAKKPLYKIINKFPYNENHIKSIKSRKINDNRYSWDSNNKSWNIYFDSKDNVDVEVDWLTENIYNNNFKGLIQLISAFDKYKDGV